MSPPGETRLKDGVHTLCTLVRLLNLTNVTQKWIIGQYSDNSKNVYDYRLFVLGSGYGELQVSTDGGKTWKTDSNTTIYALDITT